MCANVKLTHNLLACWAHCHQAKPAHDSFASWALCHKAIQLTSHLPDEHFATRPHSSWLTSQLSTLPQGHTAHDSLPSWALCHKATQLDSLPSWALCHKATQLMTHCQPNPPPHYIIIHIYSLGSSAPKQRMGKETSRLTAAARMKPSHQAPTQRGSSLVILTITQWWQLNDHDTVMTVNDHDTVMTVKWPWQLNDHDRVKTVKWPWQSDDS